MSGTRSSPSAQEKWAHRSRVNASRIADQNGGAQRHLELPDRLRERRLRHAKAFCGAGNRAQIGAIACMRPRLKQTTSSSGSPACTCHRRCVS
jgi:hypothetical protein